MSRARSTYASCRMCFHELMRTHAVCVVHERAERAKQHSKAKPVTTSWTYKRKDLMSAAAPVGRPGRGGSCLRGLERQSHRIFLEGIGAGQFEVLVIVTYSF